jgi:ketosteroid isomerase-like protein
MIGACTQSVDLEAEAEALLATDRAFAQASLDIGAAEAFKQYLAEDALQLPAGANPISGREAIYTGMLDAPEDAELAWQPQMAQLSRTGDMGYTWGNYQYSYNTSTGERAVTHGKYLNVWRKDAQRGWIVLVDMGNSSPAPE